MKVCRSIGTAALFAVLVTLNCGAIYAQDSDIDNTRIIQMVRMGLDDEIIIAKIKTGHTKFALGDEDLVQLKNSGVSGKVIAAMLESSVLTSSRVKVNGKPVELHTLGQAKVGGRLGHEATLGFKSVKWKAYLQGRHAPLVAGSKPNIEIELPPNDTPDNYIVVRMDEKTDRREVEVSSGGGTVGAKTGIRAEDVMKTSYEPLGGRRFKISVHKELKSGEYILYVVGSAHYEAGVFGKGYDFTVE